MALSLDPRIQRTRQLLRQALKALLAEQGFEELTVQDIADRATVNRATFYDHFVDKAALLEELIEDSFRQMLRKREIEVATGCAGSVQRLMLAVCDYLAELGGRCPEGSRQLMPVAEAKIKETVREILLQDLRKRTEKPELAATVASWAIYGVALEWSRSDRAQSAEAFTEAALPLIAASLKMAAPGGCPGK
ncbi:MAG: TetR/AcrR family transcriptional regulator [Verrucomicrobium sp.]|nr:TetR/AcrR family transcriptional regulator [Verrucomicrobium sp.]